MSETLNIIIISIVVAMATGAVFWPLGARAGKWFASRYYWRGFWRKPQPTMPPAFELPPINMRCPHCGEEYTIQISGGPEAPDPFADSLERGGYPNLAKFRRELPLGERLQAEKRELIARLDGGAVAGEEQRERYRRRIAAIDEQLRRFN